MSVNKKESNNSFSAKNQGFTVKTMSGLSAKNQKGGKNILDSLTKTNKRISSYCHNSEQGKLRRGTPMEHQSTHEGMKNRMMRGAYSSGKKQSMDS